MNQKIRYFALNIHSLIYFILAFLFFTPNCLEIVQSFQETNLLIYYIRLAISIVIIVFFFINNKIIRRKKGLILGSMVLFFSLIEVTNLCCGSSSTLSQGIQFVFIIAYCIIIMNAIDKHRLNNYYCGTLAYFYIITILNLLSQILLKDGFVRGTGLNWQAIYVLGNSNSFTFFLIFAAIIAIQYEFYSKKGNKKITVFYLALLVASAFLSESSACRISVILIVIAYLLSHQKVVSFIIKHTRIIVSALVIFILWIVFLKGWSNNFVLNIVQNGFHEQVNFISRVGIWDHAIQVISVHPFWGYGTDNYQFSYYISKSYGLTSAHDNYLQILYYGGIISFVAYIGMLFVLLRSHKKYALHREKGFLFIAIIVFLIVYIIEQNPFYIGFYSILVLNSYYTVMDNSMITVECNGFH